MTDAAGQTGGPSTAAGPTFWPGGSGSIRTPTLYPTRDTSATLGRNSKISPGDWNLDLGVFQNFDITEKTQLQYRWEAFNSLHYASLTNAAGQSASERFGDILSVTGPRIMQMGLRLEF